MGFWVTALLWVGTLILGRILNPRLPRVPGVDAAPEKFADITAEEGRPIPVLWGTRQFKGANIGWFGDLSSAAIGSTGLYQYYMGAQYLICLGPVDEVVAVHWNEKPVGAALSDANNKLIIGIGPPPYYTATIAPGNYPDGVSLSLAVENAMKAAQPGNWKATFGFRIRSGRNTRISWGLLYSGVYRKRTAFIPDGDYTGASLAAAIETAMQTAENDAAPFEIPNDPGTVTCSYSSNRFQLSFTAAAGGGFGYEGWALFGADDPTFSYVDSINSTIGYRMDVSRTGVTNLLPDFDVLVNRFVIAYGGTNGQLKLTDVGFTAATLLGLSTAADVDLLSKTSDSDFVVIEATFTQTTDYAQVDIDDTDFFGTEGGVQGRVEIYRGSMTQVESSYLGTRFGSTAPAYRGLCYAVQHRVGSPSGMYVGNTNYPKPISFTLRRCPNQLGLTSGQHNIAGDANPACMLWELLTDTIWGLGMPEAQLEKATFLAVGETLHAEGLGLSMILDATTPAADVVQEILRHVDGVLYVDHLSGLLALRLARADYEVATLPLVSPANALTCEVKQRSWEETRNVVRIRYVDRASNYTERIYQLQDQANIESRGGDMAVEDIPMPGLSNETAAALVGGRSLKVLSALPRQITLRVNRESWSLRPGAPFRLTWPWWGITDMPCRVATIGLGGLAEGEIRVQAVQDVIGPPWTGFVAPTAPPEDPPELPDLPEFPAPLGDRALFGDMPMPTG